VLGLAQTRGLEYGSAPLLSDGQINHLGGGRGVYIRDPDGIAYEFFTAVP
jgi:catechol 2,3-dioxygenase-like lactoylglutathione lyase family enzyme